MRKKIKEFIIEDFRKAYSCNITYQSILKQQEEVYTRLKELALAISDYLGIEEIPFEFAELENELSRIILKPVPKILITNDYCMRFTNAAFCLAHELRHAFQIYWVNFMDDSLARIWRDELSRPKNALNIDFTNEENVEEYTTQAIEIDADAFAKNYLREKLNIEFIRTNEFYEKLLDQYIAKYKSKL